MAFIAIFQRRGDRHYRILRSGVPSTPYRVPGWWKVKLPVSLRRRLPTYSSPLSIRTTHPCNTHALRFFPVGVGPLYIPHRPLTSIRWFLLRGHRSPTVVTGSEDIFRAIGGDVTEQLAVLVVLLVEAVEPTDAASSTGFPVGLFFSTNAPRYMFLLLLFSVLLVLST